MSNDSEHDVLRQRFQVLIKSLEHVLPSGQLEIAGYYLEDGEFEDTLYQILHSLWDENDFEVSEEVAANIKYIGDVLGCNFCAYYAFLDNNFSSAKE